MNATVLKAARSWRYACLVVAVGGMLAIANQAQGAVVPLPVIAVTPADSTVMAPTTASVPISITTSGVPSGAYVSGEVSTQNVAGQDGTLANDYQVSLFSLTRSDANPAVFTGSFGFGWASTPGTYYWQIATLVVDPNGNGLNNLVSPVYTIVVTAPPAPVVPVPVVTPVVTPVVQSGPDVAPPATKPYRMTLTDVAYDATLAVSKHDPTGGHLKRQCTRTSRVAFKCMISWRNLRFAYAGTLRLTDRGTGSAHSTFIGLRAKLSCLKTRDAKACARPLRW